MDLTPHQIWKGSVARKELAHFLIDNLLGHGLDILLAN